jgi:hypothetical protein
VRVALIFLSSRFKKNAAIVLAAASRRFFNRRNDMRRRREIFSVSIDPAKIAANLKSVSARDEPLEKSAASVLPASARRARGHSVS